MKKFSEIVKNVREESGLSQREFADKLEVSSIYISKIETDQKEVSRQFLSKLADFIGIHPSALAPFLYVGSGIDEIHLSSLEKRLIRLGENIQEELIKKKLSQRKRA